jgi:hypothetical protein
VTFFSPPKAKAAALNPPRDADLHVGDLIVTIPAEAVSGIEEHATGLYVVTPDGVKAAPRAKKYRGSAPLTSWTEDPWNVSVSIPRSLLVMAACDCAETVLSLVPFGMDGPRDALKVARAWVAGETTRTAVEEAARNAARAHNIARAIRNDVAGAMASLAAADAAATAADAQRFFNTLQDVGAARYHKNQTDPEETYRLLAPVIERWIPLPVVLLAALGYPSAIHFDTGMGPASPTGPRENPSHPTHRSLPRSRR